MAEMVASEALQRRAQLVLEVPLAAALGLRLLDENDPRAGAAFTVNALADNGVGGAHASAVGAALDTAAYLALAPQLTEAEHAVTHAAALQLIASAPGGQRVEVRGELHRRTGRLAFCSATATAGPQVIAHAQFTTSIVPFTPPAASANGRS